MVSDQTARKHARVLMTLYKKLYAGLYGRPALLNSNTDIWKFQNLYQDLIAVSPTRPEEVVQYYFELPEKEGKHSAVDLGNIYVDISQRIDEINEIKEKDAAIRRETEQRVKEWRNRGSKHSGTTS